KKTRQALAFRSFHLGNQKALALGDSPNLVEQYRLASSSQSKKHDRPGAAPIDGPPTRNPCCLKDHIAPRQFRRPATCAWRKGVTERVHRSSNHTDIYFNIPNYSDFYYIHVYFSILLSTCSRPLHQSAASGCAGQYRPAYY